MATISIDGKDYDADTLSAEAKAQLGSVQFVDHKIAELQDQLAVFQTARLAYARELLTLLPAEPASPVSETLITSH